MLINSWWSVYVCVWLRLPPVLHFVINQCKTNQRSSLLGLCQFVNSFHWDQNKDAFLYFCLYFYHPIQKRRFSSMYVCLFICKVVCIRKGCSDFNAFFYIRWGVVCELFLTLGGNCCSRFQERNTFFWRKLWHYCGIGEKFRIQGFPHCIYVALVWARNVY